MFWLRKVLRATMTCTFSTFQLPKWCVLYILTSKCASPHNGVQFFDISTSKSSPKLRFFVHFDFDMCFAPQTACNFFISHLARWFRACPFSEPTVRPFEAANHWKNAVNSDFFYLFRALASSFLLTLSLLWSSLFCFFSFLALTRLCFSICPYCRKFDFETSFDQSIKTIENQTKTNPNTKQIPTLHHRKLVVFSQTACPQPGAEVGSKSLRLGEVSGASNTEPCSRLLEKTGLL